jgi:radical SAM superfamily enzyme YgiQ (UPF0313 family)
MKTVRTTAELLRKPIERISFIYPPYGVVKNEPGIRAVKENYGVFPSLSLAYVAAVAEKEGLEVQFIDAHALGLSLEETIRRVKAFGPNLLAFTVTTYLFYQTLAWVRALREAIAVPTLLGGVHMSIYPEETLSHHSVDFGCTGEAEMVLPQFFAALNNGGDLSKIAGLIWRDGERVVVNECAPLLMDIDSAPFPARHHLPNDRYYSFISQFQNFTPMITSRGCPFRCIFCEQGGQKFRPRSPLSVGDEIDECYHVFKVREFDFFDSSFTVQKQRVIDICEEIVRRGIKVYWAIRSRVDLVNEEMLKALARAGCKRIYYGIESGDPDVLKTLRKETNIELIREIMALTRKHKIDTFGYFMIGSPGETAETVKHTIKFSIDLKLDYAQFSKVTPMPATELYRMLVDDVGRDYWREYILDESKDLYLPRPRTKLTEEDVQELTRKAYLAFYFRPRYVLKACLRLKSWRELTRSLRTAWSMFSQRNRVFENTWTKKIQY